MAMLIEVCIIIYNKDIIISTRFSINVIPFQPVRADDENTKALKEVEDKMTKQEKKLGDITYELDGIHRVRDDLNFM